MMAGVVPNPGQSPASAMQQKLIDAYKDIAYFDTRKRESSHMDVTTFLSEIYKLPHLIVADGDQHHASDGPEIRCCENMFYNDKEPCHDIYITGDPGVGKTSLCQYMSLLWAMCKEGKTVINRRIKKDAKFLSRFDFLFFIKLRETNHTDIIDILVDRFLDPTSLDERTSMCRTMKETLQCNTCLVILDGLDEWAPRRNVEIPSKPSGSTCVILTTCRPYRYDSVRLANRSIDLHVKLMGLHICSVESIIFEWFNMCEQFNNKSSDEFLEEAKQYDLDGLLSNSLMMRHVAETWCSQPFSSLSRAQVYGNLVESFFGKSPILPMHLEYVLALDPQPLLLGILSNYEYLNKHKLMLRKVSLLAFLSLFNNDVDRTNLVFTIEELTSIPYCLSNREIDFLCAVGIVSENKIGGSETKLCFVHPNFVEFFAAVFLSSFYAENYLHKLKKPTSINEILHFTDFFCSVLEWLLTKMNMYLTTLTSCYQIN